MSIVQIIGAILEGAGILGIIIGLPLGIFLEFKAHGEQDPAIKKKIKRKALWSFLGPLLFLFVFAFLWGIMQAIQTP